MNRRLSLLALFALFIAASAPAASTDTLERIAFGSCAGQDRPQEFWGYIGALQPQLFLFLGDNVYADTMDPEALRYVYAALARKRGFAAFRSTCTIMATWDDHDYGANDVGADHPRKEESQKEFQDFFGVPKGDPRRARKGVYDAQIFGPPGRRVQVIMLDTRYFRSPLKKVRTKKWPQPYAPQMSPKVTILGAEQWAWLRQQLLQPAEIRIIGSSVQFAAEEQIFEKWANFPLERKRMIELIRSTKAKGVVFVSGDRHQAEISVINDGVPYPIYDVTSSSLNKPEITDPKVPFEANKYRVGPQFRGANFGFMTIDWHKSPPAITFEIHSSTGDLVTSQTVPLNRLSPK